ncbi:hypothetical protein [Microbacterium sp.]|nr:hypothetical protein CZ774_10585 [Frigoribacterium sp. JB110]
MDAREQTDVDRVADGWVDALARLLPTVATAIGRDEGQDRF